MGSKLLLETSHNGTEEQADTLSEIFRETLRNAKEYNMDWVKKPEQLWRNTLVNLEEGEKLCKASKKLLHLEEKGPTGEKGKARNDRHEKVLALIPKIYEKMQKLKDAAKDLVAVFHGLTAEVERRSSPRLDHSRTRKRRRTCLRKLLNYGRNWHVADSSVADMESFLYPLPVSLTAASPRA